MMLDLAIVMMICLIFSGYKFQSICKVCFTQCDSTVRSRNGMMSS